MYILAIETTGLLCSVALLEDNRILKEKNSISKKSSERPYANDSGYNRRRRQDQV